MCCEPANKYCACSGRCDGGLEGTRKSRWCDPDKPKGSHQPHLVHINDFEEELEKVDEDDWDENNDRAARTLPKYKGSSSKFLLAPY